MLHLTRQERLLVAGLLFAFLIGLAVKHYRRPDGAGTPAPPAEFKDAKR
jgi:hypothetical protein